MIIINNDGQEILGTNYFVGRYARNGIVFCSVNAGAVRVLIPDILRREIPEMRRGLQHCVLSRGMWPLAGREGIEILFEDGSSDPYALHLTPESFDRAPAIDEDTSPAIISLWVSGPRKAFETTLYMRRVSTIPCLEPFEIPEAGQE